MNDYKLLKPLVVDGKEKLPGDTVSVATF